MSFKRTGGSHFRRKKAEMKPSAPKVRPEPGRHTERSIAVRYTQRTEAARHTPRTKAAKYAKRKSMLHRDRRGTLYLMLTALAAIMLIVLAVVLIGAADNRKYEKYMEEASANYTAGDFDSSLRYLRKAAELNPGEECLLLMVDCYEQQGNLDKALQILRSMDVSESVVSKRIDSIEQKRKALLEPEMLSIAGKLFPADTTGLVLDSMGIGNDTLGEVLQLYALDNLSLVDNDISDISPLSQLGGLSTLNLSGNNVEDLTPLYSLTGLRTLYLDDNPIKDLTPVCSLKNLTSLSIKGIPITEEQLQTLSKMLPDCAIHSDADAEDVSDISIGGVTFKSDVTELDLSGLGIRDISALSECKNLTKLNLKGNKISELSALMNLPELQWLDVSENQISDLRPLMGMSTLRYVNAEKNKIRCTVSLGAMTALTELKLSDNPIDDFTGFNKLRGLQSLELRNTGLDDEGLDSLGYLSSLIRLDIKDNPDISGEGVDAMAKRLNGCTIDHSKLVYSVEIGGNKVRADATELNLAGTGISALEALSNFERLESLNLEKNSISNIYIFQIFNSRTTLKNVDLSGNIIEDITPVASLSAVETLDISDNKINSILPLMRLGTLKTLYISGNPLSEEQIQTLQEALSECEIIWK